MSGTETQTAADPSDPQAAAAAIVEDRAARERAYQESLARVQARAATAEQRVQTLTADRASLEFSTVSNALDAAERQRDLLRSQYRAAAAEADSDKMADLTAQMGEVAAEMVQLRAGKHQMEAARNQRLAPEPTRQEAAPSQLDTEQQLSQLHPATAAWIRSQRDTSGAMKYFSDPQFKERVTRAHFHALGEGKAEFSPEYYDHVERRAGLKPETEAPRPSTPASASEQEDGRGSPPMAAPVRQAASYTDNARRGGDEGHIPRDTIDFCVRVMKFTDRKGQPDMAKISDYWRESRQMGRTGKFLNGEDPWAGAR